MSPTASLSQDPCITTGAEPQRLAFCEQEMNFWCVSQAGEAVAVARKPPLRSLTDLRVPGLSPPQEPPHSPLPYIPLLTQPSFSPSGACSCLDSDPSATSFSSTDTRTSFWKRHGDLKPGAFCHVKSEYSELPKCNLPTLMFSVFVKIPHLESLLLRDGLSGSSSRTN